MFVHTRAAFAAIALTATAAHAQNFDDIQFWIGSGSNQAGLVIDWHDGKAPAALAWGYRWDGTATGEEMLRAVIAADTNLYASFSEDGPFGVSTFGLGYDLTPDDTFSVTPGVTFVDRINVNPTYEGIDDVAPTNPQDHYRSGWLTSGYWTYWAKENAADPWTSPLDGMSDLQLTSNAWTGFSFDSAYSFILPPGEPVAAVIPEPAAMGGLLAAGALLGLRRRRSRKVVAPLAVAGGMMVAAAGTTAHAAYVYDPADFAVEVVSSTNLPASNLYDDPTAVLGGPATFFKNTFPVSTRRVKLIEAPYNVGANDEKLLTTFNAGQSVTVRMGRRVYDDPNNPFGIDLNVFGNTAFFPGGAYVTDATNLNTATTTGSVLTEEVRVSVSPNNIDWYTFAATGDGLFPTNAYRWDRTSASWTDEALDPTRPVNPVLSDATFAGMTGADILDLYDGSAGGTGFDLALSGFDWIEFVRFDGITGFAGGEIDAVAAVRPIPEPAAMGVLGFTAAALLRRRRA